MAVCDLDTLFGPVIEQVPEDLDDEYVFSASTLPQLPPVLTTDRLSIRIGTHAYQSYTVNRVDGLHFQAHKQTYRMLGMCLLAKVFHAEPREVRIDLTNPHSAVRTLVLDYDQSEGSDFVSGYHKRPHQLTYVAEAAEKYTYALDEKYFPQYLLPLFVLTNIENVLCSRDEEWNARDTVRCAGSDYGSILFATLLLNLGRSAETKTEIALESSYGYGGVGPASAEVTLWLPGGLGWLEHVQE